MFNNSNSTNYMRPETMKKTPTEEKFSDFYSNWVSQLEQHLTSFLLQDSSDYETLIAKLTTHHKNYYRVKWAAAHDDVCAFFTPVWLTPLETAYLWVTGWKPSAVFRFVDTLRRRGTGLADLTEEQVKKIEGLRVKIRMEEEKVEREMERQQVGLADRRMVELARGGGGGDAAAAAEAAVLGGLERMMKMGDCVRLKALKGLLDVMNPKQCVELLAAQAMFHVQLRKCGDHRKL